MLFTAEYRPLFEREISYLQQRSAYFYACSAEFLADDQPEMASRCQCAAASYAELAQVRLTQLLFGDETQMAAAIRMTGSL